MAQHPTLDTLASIADALQGLDLAGLDDDELIAALRLGTQLSGQVSALEVSLAGQADERSHGRDPDESLARSHGCRNVTELLQRTTLVSARMARSRVRLAGLTNQRISLVGAPIAPRYQFLSRGLRSGQLVEESALLFADTLDRAVRANPADVEVAEQSLVEAATGLDFSTGSAAGLAAHTDTIRSMCRMWEQALDPDGAEPNDEVALRDRCLNLGAQKHGLVPISGRLLPEVATVLARIVDAVGSPRTEKQSSVQQEPEGEAAIGWIDRRSAAQKRHDILAMALGVAAQSQEMPLLGGAPITVVVQISADDLASGKGTGWIHGHDGAVTPVSRSTVRHGACSGSLQLVTQDEKDRITALGSPSRVFTANQRRAIMVRDGGCVIPGCTVPPTWCEIHHVEPHARGGPTHIDNGAMLCFFHHRTIDSGGWSVKMMGGLPHVKAPPWLDPSGTWREARSGRYLLTV